jgi:hypothetical protein
VAAIPGIVRADTEAPRGATIERNRGAPWQVDWRDVFYLAPDEIRNHDKPVFLGVLDGTESVTDWNPWDGRTGPTPWRAIRHGYASDGVQEYGQAAPLAIDNGIGNQPMHAQAQLSGVSSIAALVPFMDLPNGLPYHYDEGLQLDSGGAIGPRMIFRGPPSFNDQSAAIYAAGF